MPPRPDYRFGVLGPLTVERHGEPITIASAQQRALLAVLLAARRPLTRDALIDELWGEQPPPSAVKALSVLLSRLRRQLGEAIAFRSGGYELTVEYELDADRFSALVARAREDRAGDARALLSEALALFRGEPLADVESEGSIARWRRELARQQLDAIVARVDLDLEAGAGAELVGELERLVEEHPYEERIWGQLMLALNRAGRQADALEAYQRVRRLFAYELGIEPGEPLAQLQQRILAGDQTRSEGGLPGPPSSEGVPLPLGPLVGRTAELAELTKALADPACRLLTLIGPGGVGKTRLALELAHAQQDRFADGALLVRLEHLDDPALLAAEIAAALGRRQGGTPPVAERLAAALSGTQMLLVLDNFEQLLPAAPAVADLLASVPSLRVLVTSRMPLRLRGEQLFEVQPLAAPAGEGAAAARESPAVALFITLATAIDRNLVADEALLRTAASICRRVDGLPLGIELATAQLRVLTPAQLDSSLERPLALAGHAPRDLPDRQQTLAQTIRWSYDLLEPRAREVLLAAGVFRGGFTLAALAAVIGHPVQAELGALLDASLVRREPSGERFRVLELVRAFALQELNAGGGLSALRARHRDYFAALSESIAVELDDGDPPQRLALQLRPEQANLRAAYEDAFQVGDGAGALALVRGMRSLWYDGWQRSEGQELIGRLLERFEIDPADELILLRAASFLDGGDPNAIAEGSFTHRLAERARELGDLPALSVAVANLCSLALNARDLERVAALKPQLLELAESEIPPRHRSGLNYSLGLALYLEGDLNGAKQRAAIAAEQAESVDHAYATGMAVVLQTMLSAFCDGEIRRAELTHAVATVHRAAVRPLSVIALWLAARYAAEVDRKAALRSLHAAETIYVNLGVDIWPESDLREQTLARLGLSSVPLDPGAPEPDFLVALADAVSWLEERDPSEAAVRLTPVAAPGPDARPLGVRLA